MSVVPNHTHVNNMSAVLNPHFALLAACRFQGSDWILKGAWCISKSSREVYVTRYQHNLSFPKCIHFKLYGHLWIQCPDPCSVPWDSLSLCQFHRKISLISVGNWPLKCSLRGLSENRLPQKCPDWWLVVGCYCNGPKIPPCFSRTTNMVGLLLGNRHVRHLFVLHKSSTFGQDPCGCF